MDETYKLAIERIAHECTKAIIERLIELGILAKEYKQELLGRVDDFFAIRRRELMKNHSNGKYTALNDASTAY